jgi:excisionase family DNA binding protein
MSFARGGHARAIARNAATGDPGRRNTNLAPLFGAVTIESESMSGLTLPPILTIGEAAKYLGLHRDRITGAMNKHELTAVYLEGRRFCRPPDLVEWLASRGVKLMEFAR